MNKNAQYGIFDIEVPLDKLPVKGRHIKVEANSDDLAELAKIARVSDVGRFNASLHVARVDAAIQVQGKMSAEITQPCVITLEPVHQRIEEILDRVFLPKTKEMIENAPGSETYIDLGPEDVPDYFEGNSVDLTAYLLETLGLSIDLYPKIAGAKMSEAQAGDNPDSLSPFAALKSLEIKN